MRQSPFRDCLDPRFFYQGPTHDEALARLHYLVEQHRRLGLLMGPAGSGKSLLLEVLAARLRRSGRSVAQLGLVGMEPAEMLAMLAAQLGCHLDGAEPLAAGWRALTDRLAQQRYQQIDTAILLDDADQAAGPLLPHLLRLAKLQPGPSSRLTLILAGRRERMGRLGEPILGLAELRIDLEPWQPDDVEGFLHTSLQKAGCPDAVFAPPAVTRLCELSHGIPRQVRQLADLALLAGAGRNLEQIDADVLQSVYHELGLGS
jgi:type II secretory pathway predicted ATPase ExeA